MDIRIADGEVKYLGDEIPICHVAIVGKESNLDDIALKTMRES